MDTSESNIVFIIITVLIFVGVLASVGYYFGRFYFKTDHDKDIEQKGKGEGAGTSVKNVLPQLSEPHEKSFKEALRDSQEARELELVSTQPDSPVLEFPPEVAPEPRKELSEALEKTRETLFGRMKALFSSGELSSDEMEGLEEILYTSDLGPKTVQRLMDSVHDKLSGSEKANIDKVRQALKQEMGQIFSHLSANGADRANGQAMVDEVADAIDALPLGDKRPQVWLVVGVNGAGKTTTIGKLAFGLAKKGYKTLVAAGDTFRAAAGDQLRVWTQRAQVEIFHLEGVSDPSAVAYDACQKAHSGGFDVVIIDTAGRLHTQKNLMDELRKMKRVMQKVIPEAPHETLLVLDANSGQNALVQAQFFNEALELSGVVLTKLDGTAKGGVALGLACEMELPIRLIGVGEGIEDLRPFRSQEFVDSII